MIRPSTWRSRWTGAFAVTGAVVALALAFAAARPNAEGERRDAARLRSSEPDPATPEGDPSRPEYWRYCSIDGFLASACGGTVSSCPPGTRMSPVTWIGTCRNPADGKDYIVSYNDCCGKGPCGGGFVHRNEGDKPVYYTHKSNDVGWCMGAADAAYNSTVSIVLGVAEGPDH